MTAATTTATTPTGMTTTAPTTTATTTATVATATRASSAGSDRLYGLTIDDVSNLGGIVSMLKALPRRATVRIVFDEGQPASDYRPAVAAIQPYADIMGEILDSSAMKGISVEGYRARAQEYVSAFHDEVALWEIGNEVNGEWLGDTEAVVQKIEAAAQQVQAVGGKTALTLYENAACYDRPENEMVRWASTNLSPALRASIDHALVSYYEDDCDNARPSWGAEFGALRTLFPNARLGFGESGLPRPVTSSTLSHAEDVMRRYYRLDIPVPGYEGGGFWWNAAEDLVGSGRPLTAVLHDVWAAPVGPSVGAGR